MLFPSELRFIKKENDNWFYGKSGRDGANHRHSQRDAVTKNWCKKMVDAPNRIIALYLFYNGQFIIFERDDGYYGPITGNVRPQESHINAAIRELREETSICLSPYLIHQTPHIFSGISPKGRKIHGVSFYSILHWKVAIEMPRLPMVIGSPFYFFWQLWWYSLLLKTLLVFWFQ